MAENNPKTLPADETVGEIEEKQNFVSRFAVKHPRVAKVAAITGGVTAVAGVLLTANTVRKNRNHLIAAGDHAKEALTELSTSVSPATDPEA